MCKELSLFYYYLNSFEKGVGNLHVVLLRCAYYSKPFFFCYFPSVTNANNVFVLINIIYVTSLIFFSAKTKKTAFILI